jgi:hypothetical protein
MINKGWWPYMCVLFPRDKVMVTLWLWIHYSCLSLIIVWWALINNKHKLSKINNDFILNDTTIWNSYFMIKYMWNFILMNYIVTRCLIFIQYKSYFVWWNDSNSALWSHLKVILND